MSNKEEIKDEDTQEVEDCDKVEDTTTQQSEDSEEETSQEKEPTIDEILQQKDEEIQLYKDKYQRANADFQNYKRRSEEEKKEFVKYANEGVILEVLEAYEDLGRALQQDEKVDLREGVEMIYNKLTNILEKEGVEPINTENEKFDPFKHEALLTEANEDYEDNDIIQEIQKGYTLNSKVIRYSKVKVCKNK
ncbi:MAG: nucleotide exchange factor GrpE [Methanosphaera sp.]|nr:nucleotide exchange factor GrpE [Methanosphaera sp.]